MGFYIMLNKSSILSLSRFGIISSILYSIPVIFFLKDQRYNDTWFLYLGNAVFLICIFIFGIVYGGKKINQASKNSSAEKDMGKDVDLNMERNRQMIRDEGQLARLEKNINFLQLYHRNGINISWLY